VYLFRAPPLGLKQGTRPFMEGMFAGSGFARQVLLFCFRQNFVLMDRSAFGGLNLLEWVVLN